jgi:hypothetical protein
MTTTTDLRPDAQNVDASEVADVLELMSAPRKQVLRTKNMMPGATEEYVTLEYTQRKLSFFGKMRFYARVSAAIDDAMEGDDGLTVSAMVNTLLPLMEGGVDNIDRDKLVDYFRQVDLDIFLQGFFKLVRMSDDFLLDCYAIWLGVPDYQEALAKDIMKSPEEQGGLSDEDGMAILDTFIDQNAELIKDFFGRLLVQTVKRARKRLGGSSDGSSTPSTPSSTTRRTTRRK